MNNITYIRALKDNYVWLVLSDDKTKAAAIDPGQAEPVLHYLKQHNIILSDILLTHYHQDHTAGVSILKKTFQAKVWAYSTSTHAEVDEEIQAKNHIFLHTVKTKFAILKTPGHTKDAICYFDGLNLFSGDTLFAGGCGRLFEGTAEQMYHSLNTLRELPESTNVYCGHEYTCANLEFALSLEPDNQTILSRLAEVNSLQKQNQASLPSTIGIEKNTNPFLRCNDPEFGKIIAKKLACQTSNPLELFTAIRKYKDNWSK
jgi:hydroxyacylglutathione hydrolase